MFFNPKKIRECFQSLTTFSNWAFLGLLITVSAYFLFKQTEKRIVQQTVSSSSKVTKGPVSFEQKLESSSTIPSVPNLRKAPVVQAGKANLRKKFGVQ